MTYHRGTDLKHCPDDCAYISFFQVSPSTCEISCFAAVYDTCTREEAEKQKAERSAEICAQCFYDQSIYRCAECQRPKRD